MTGIDRLRAIAGAWDEWGLGGTLAEIADEIERERAEGCYRTGFDCGTVWRVASDMERHCLGHEGMEDSPVARWARELRGALKSDASDGRDAQNPSCADADGAAGVTSDAPKVTRDPAKDVSMSAYDLLPADEREAIAWVRERGGIDYVKREWRSRVPRDCYERRRQRLLGHIAECEMALGRRREVISELAHRVSDLTTENAELRRRAIPEGCQWPRYESGEPVGFGGEVSRLGEVFSISLYCDGSFALNFRAYSKGERVRRPAPAVPASDGEPLEVGQTVWDTNGDELVIEAIEDGGHTVVCRYADVGDSIPTHGMWSPSDLTHQRPVLDVDGVPTHEGDEVWDATTSAGPFTVREVERSDDPDEPEDIVWCGEHAANGFKVWRIADQLTHAKPEIDTWQRIEEDATKNYVDYWGCGRFICSECPAVVDGKRPWERFGCGDYPEASKNCTVAKARDIVRRCRALAERERGE